MVSSELVYLIQAGEHYKIGRTANLQHRLAILQTSQPFPLRIVETWETPQASSLERYLQGQFSECRTSGEWFCFDNVDLIGQAVGRWFEQIMPRIARNPEIMLAAMPRRPKARSREGKRAHPLLQWRERYGVSQMQVKVACGISQATLSKIENWQRVPLGENLEKLRAYTGLPTDAFIRPKHFLAEEPTFLDRTHPPRPSPHAP